MSAKPSNSRLAGPEKPLAPSARLGLALGLAALQLLFYAGVLLTLLYLAAWMVVGALVAIAAFRVGLHVRVIEGLYAQQGLAAAFIRSLRLRKQEEDSIPLAAEDAPRLHSKAENVARQMGVPPPDVIKLQMGNNAAVRLRGYRAGRGHCTLFVGYDLLVVLDAEEVQAVVAHEMAHARLIQRGFQGWVWNSLQRSIQVMASLQEIVEPLPSGRRFYTAEGSLFWVERLCKSGVGMLARYARQEEFAADYAAARFCGTPVYSSALIRIHAVESLASEIQWRERVLQLQCSPGTFAAWLRERLTPAPEKLAELEQRARENRAVQPLDHHPALADRLAHLPGQVPATLSPPGAPAVETLLKDPERLADRLVDHMEAVAARAEQKENELLLRHVRKEHRGASRAHRSGVGGALILVGGLVAAAGGLMLDPNYGAGPFVAGVMMLFGAMLIGIGVLKIRNACRRERRVLPLPDLNRWEDALEARKAAHRQYFTGSAEEQKMKQAPVRTAMEGRVPPQLSRSAEKFEYWADAAYAALAEADFLGAWIAGYHCLSLRDSAVEGRLARGIAAAYFGDYDEMRAHLGAVLQHEGLGPSVSAGAGWAQALTGSWNVAEAYLLDARSHRSDDAQVEGFLAWCHWQRDKLREAAGRAGRAAELAQNPSPFRLFRARVLLEAGRARDADADLRQVGREDAKSYRGVATRLRTCLLLGQDQEVPLLTEQLASLRPPGETNMNLGHAYREARRYPAAREYYYRSLDSGHQPLALLYAGECWRKEGNLVEARVCIAGALNLTRETAEDVPSALTLLPAIWSALAATSGPENPVDGCELWIGSFTVDVPPKTYGNLSLHIVARSPERAAEMARWVYEAMLPGREWRPETVQWRPGPADSRPDGPSLEGVFSHQFRPTGPPGSHPFGL